MARGNVFINDTLKKAIRIFQLFLPKLNAILSFAVGQNGSLAADITCHSLVFEKLEKLIEYERKSAKIIAKLDSE